MAKVLNITEAKMMMKDGKEVERVIFSDDKIIYVNSDTGEVKPATVSQKYVDLVSVYNATHLIPFEGKTAEATVRDEYQDFEQDAPKSMAAVKADGAETREAEINKTANLRGISHNHKVQDAINSILSLGTWLIVGGIIEIALAIILLFAATSINDYAIGMMLFYWLILGGLGVAHLVCGAEAAKLASTPSGLRGIAIFTIVAGAGGFIVRIVTLVYAIIVLTKMHTYEDWYYKRIN